MKVIGLTGGIASGKSTVSDALVKLGAIIIDGDKIAHRTMEPDQPAWAAIVEHFGPKILKPDRTIDRAKLGAIVFDDSEQLKALNSITRPWISKDINSELAAMRLAQPEAVLFLDIPLLYEAKMDKMCDQIWVIWVDRETQIERLMKRNNFTRDEAVKRIDAQMSLDEKARLADIVIDNSASIEETLSLATRYYLDILQNA